MRRLTSSVCCAWALSRLEAISVSRAYFVSIIVRRLYPGLLPSFGEPMMMWSVRSSKFIQEFVEEGDVKVSRTVVQGPVSGRGECMVIGAVTVEVGYEGNA